MRRSGVLLPIFSLPSKQGIGAFSKEAYDFVDFLEKAGQKLWQLLPLSPTSFGDSPYQSFSAFAGNPYFIDLYELEKKGWLTKSDIEGADLGSSQTSIDYEKIYFNMYPLFRKAYEKSDIKNDSNFIAFCKENSDWLDDYALFMAVKNDFGGRSYLEWDDDIRTRQPKALEKYLKKDAAEVEFYKFLQYEFDLEWKALKKYANDKGIEIVGDIPIYVSPDSADVWANPQYFQLDSKGFPIDVAGCPPDCFSATGQLWGNPLYEWEVHEKEDYEWWIKRIAHCFKLYDIVRIDHFRGFESFYCIPYGKETAEIGEWRKGPGMKLFNAIKKTLGDIPIIAEDLGLITEPVRELLKESGYPGMKVMEFAFDSREPSNYLPYNYDKNCIVYTGTHDNSTLAGWIKIVNKDDIKFAKKYLQVKFTCKLREAIIRACMNSVADTCIIPLQDYLGIDDSGRINEPSTVGKNWKWRMKPQDMNDKLAAYMSDMVKLYNR